MAGNTISNARIAYRVALIVALQGQSEPDIETRALEPAGPGIQINRSIFHTEQKTSKICFDIIRNDGGSIAALHPGACAAA